MTKTESAPVAIVTGKEKELAVLLTPELLDELTKFGEALVSSGCGGKKRDLEACTLNGLRHLRADAYPSMSWVMEMTGASEGLANLLEYYAIGEAMEAMATTIGAAIMFLIVKKVAEKIADKSQSGMPLLFDFGKPHVGKPPTKIPPPKENADEHVPKKEDKCNDNVGTGPLAPFCHDCGGSSTTKICTMVCGLLWWPSPSFYLVRLSNGF